MCEYVLIHNCLFYEVLGIKTYSFGRLPGQDVETSGGVKGDNPMPLSETAVGNNDLWS